MGATHPDLLRVRNTRRQEAAERPAVDVLECGTCADRDYNAVVNVVVAAGLAETLNARGGSARLRLAEADRAKQEPTEWTRTQAQVA